MDGDMLEHTIDPIHHPGQVAAKAFFGATVRYTNAAGTERAVSIVGTDEVDLDRNHISWMSPLGRALLSRQRATAWLSRRRAVRNI